MCTDEIKAKKKSLFLKGESKYLLNSEFKEKHQPKGEKSMFQNEVALLL